MDNEPVDREKFGKFQKAAFGANKMSPNPYVNLSQSDPVEQVAVESLQGDPSSMSTAQAPTPGQLAAQQVPEAYSRDAAPKLSPQEMSAQADALVASGKFQGPLARLQALASLGSDWAKLQLAGKSSP